LGEGWSEANETQKKILDHAFEYHGGFFGFALDAHSIYYLPQQPQDPFGLAADPAVISPKGLKLP
jgi:hypothetical protein